MRREWMPLMQLIYATVAMLFLLISTCMATTHGPQRILKASVGKTACLDTCSRDTLAYRNAGPVQELRAKSRDSFGRRLITRYYFILLLSSIIFCSTDFDVIQEDNVKIVEADSDVNFTCTFPWLVQSTKTWIKQTNNGKSLQIVSLYERQKPSWNHNLEKTNRFNVAKGELYFNLTIFKTKPSDSATYYCVVSSYQGTGMGSGTRLLVRDAVADRNTTLHQSLIDTVDPGDSVNLQCSIFTESCAGDHSVYWFKQSSGDSEGVLYTKGERNGRCKNNTESQTQSCVYSLHKNNISHSDTGIYYCAVAACGEILFGRGTQLNIRESDFNPALLALGISNILFLALVVFLGIKLCRSQIKTSAAQTTQMTGMAEMGLKFLRSDEFSEAFLSKGVTVTGEKLVKTDTGRWQFKGSTETPDGLICDLKIVIVTEVVQEALT
ncbi:uncharacterized protein LOC130232650 [Danio aesculapii]|uniref:uncharacterized protein LOC130232650 n=1 Tax=Danio aesculapii TaxID=1142201 RepID=UPI0024BF5976|nr:uncharacterized protein LOC130232650 [Danio aesculapii]